MIGAPHRPVKHRLPSEKHVTVSIGVFFGRPARGVFSPAQLAADRRLRTCCVDKRVAFARYCAVGFGENWWKKGTSMAATVRPSLIFQIDLDGRSHFDEAVAEIKRSHSYVAPTTLTTRTPGEGPACNVMRFRIKLHNPYWSKNDLDAEALWPGVMPMWLHNMFYKVSSTVVADNNRYRSQGESGLAYAWVGLDSPVASFFRSLTNAQERLSICQG